MTISLVAVVVLIIGLLLHAFSSPPPSGWRGGATLNELGRSMIWIGMFFLVGTMMGHGQLILR